MDQSTPTLSVVMAAFNRRDTTLACLERLHQQAGFGTDWLAKVYLLDDASTDGTGEAVRSAFPEVTVIDGTGDLFWGGGMHAAMQEAVRHDYDFLLWLNDDVVMAPDAISRLLGAYSECSATTGHALNVMAGTMVDPESGTVSYSGFRRTSSLNPAAFERIVELNDRAVECDTFNGNLVLVPKALVDRIGIIDGKLIHQLGDIDYGYRAVAAGGKVWIAPGVFGACAPNLRVAPWKDPRRSFARRVAAINTPLGLPAKSWWTFMMRHGGLLGLPGFVYVQTRAFCDACLCAFEKPRVSP